MTVISAEAAYHIYGLGAGSYDVAPWNDAETVFRSDASSWTSVLLGEALGVLAADLVGEVLSTGASIASAVAAAGVFGLGYVPASTALQSESQEQTKRLAYQHYGQSCGYLPDRSRDYPDLWHVRTGQYALTTTSSLLARSDEGGAPEDDRVRLLVGWLDGTLAPPESVEVLDLIAQTGAIPLCAMLASRPSGDASALQSYAHPDPCHGYFEALLRGDPGEYQPCETTAECDGAHVGEQCRHGFCEAY